MSFGMQEVRVAPAWAAEGNFVQTIKGVLCASVVYLNPLPHSHSPLSPPSDFWQIFLCYSLFMCFYTHTIIKKSDLTENGKIDRIVLIDRESITNDSKICAIGNLEIPHIMQRKR